ncbi:MAG: VanZ family protein [Clostridiales bacterium]|nr:VanZ family protein [Clostridiales bacterium]
MKIRRKQRITGFLVIVWMSVIFAFSAQPGAESGRVSGGVAYRIISTTNRIFGMELSVSELLRGVQILDYPLRKGAHMTEYAILGALTAAFFASMGRDGKRRYVPALLTAAAYAVTDEIHQLFVPGRTGKLSDVCIDTVGAAVGLLGVYLLGKIVRKHCEKRRRPLQYK